MTIIFLLNNCSNVFALEVTDKIKKESKDILKTLTRKSLNKDEILIFLSEYVIIIDDKRGDGSVIYYFDDFTYKRYNNLILISEDKWNISKLGFLKLYNNNIKETWKIQPSKENTINIKKKFNSLGELYKFSYEDKTNFYLKLEEKKLNDSQ
jgi:hypothetical protein